MVRTYVRKTTRAENSIANINDAVTAVLDGASLRKTADVYGFNKDTLSRAVKKKTSGVLLLPMSEACKTRQVFNENEEEELAAYILTCCQMGFPMNTQTLRQLAFELATRNKKTHPSSWNEDGLAGRDWMQGFLKRHPNISIRTPEPTSVARAQAFSKENVEKFYQQLTELYQKYGFTPERVYNCDETGTRTSQKPTKVMAASGVKQVAQMVSHEKGELVTMLAFINAVGTALPPCLVFPRVQYKKSMLHRAPPGTSGFANKSGWMNKDTFLESLKHFQKHVGCSKDNKVLLILDNHSSHVSLDTVDFCRDNGIVILSLPPHTSHRLQPLDKTVFGPFKHCLHIAANEWMYQNPGERMTIHEIASVIGIAFPLAFTISNIVNGFKSTGICPLNSQIFSEADFLQSTMFLRDETTLLEECDPAEEVSALGVDADDRASESNFQECSPEMVRPHPSATQRKSSGRKRGTSRIYTDTPERNHLEKKELSKRKTSKSNSSKSAKRKRLFDTTCVSANFHQGDDVFSESSRGRQCTAMAAAAAIFTKEKSVLDWGEKELNHIMLFGDFLYNTTIEKIPSNVTGYLLISDIENQVSIFNKTFLLRKSNPSCGVIAENQHIQEAMTLKASVSNVFTSFSTAILIMDSASLMLHRDEAGQCFVFDSHARDAQGMPSPDGKCILMKIQGIDNLLHYLHDLARELSEGVITYELVGVDVEELQICEERAVHQQEPWQPTNRQDVEGGLNAEGAVHQQEPRQPTNRQDGVDAERTRHQQVPLRRAAAKRRGQRV